MEFFYIALVVAFLILFFANVRVVPQATQYVIEFLGKYHATWDAGIHVKIPIVQKIAKRITLSKLG